MDRSRYLYVRGRIVCHRIPWGHMPQVTHGPWDYTQLIVTTSDLVLLLWGERLDPIADTIASATCSLVQEFDPNYFMEPTDPNAPFIARVESKLRHGVTLDAQDAARSEAAPQRKP
jgi:hypothetical protein